VIIKPEFHGPINGVAIESTPQTRRVRYLFVLLLWVPWSWFCMNMLGRLGWANPVSLIFAVSLSLLLSQAFGLYVEFLRRSAEFGNTQNYILDKLFADPAFLAQWNKTAAVRMPAAVLSSQDLISDAQEEVSEEEV
jgi:hypothetical protein